MNFPWRQYLPSDAADWTQLAVLVLVVYLLLRLVRGTIAASILRSRGYDARPVIEGGMAGWHARGGDTVEFRRCGSAPL